MVTVIRGMTARQHTAEYVVYVLAKAMVVAEEGEKSTIDQKYVRAVGS